MNHYQHVQVEIEDLFQSVSQLNSANFNLIKAISEGNSQLSTINFDDISKAVKDINIKLNRIKSKLEYVKSQSPV